MLIQKHDLTIRRMRDHPDDYAHMARWRSNPDVLEFYGGRDKPLDMDGVLARYRPRVLGHENVTPCIVTLGQSRIGYMQTYTLSPQDKQRFAFPIEERVFGIDLFIGETRLWNQGIGTRMVAAMLDYLFLEQKADRVMIDPEMWNRRAVRCYEKAGFRKVRILPEHELHEGIWRDSWLMVVEAEGNE